MWGGQGRVCRGGDALSLFAEGGGGRRNKEEEEELHVVLVRLCGWCEVVYVI